MLLTLTGCSGDTMGPGDPVGQIAFVRDGKIHVMLADGSEVRQVRVSGDVEYYPAWSPNGDMIAFSRVADTLGSRTVAGIYTMRLDGSQVRRVWGAVNCSDDPCHLIADESHPTWSPDGTRLAFTSNHENFFSYYTTRIYTVNLDGSQLIATNPVRDSLHLPDWYPAWSPDGSKIAFASYRAFPQLFAPGSNDDIYVMNPDGAGVVRLTNTPDWERWPAWSPDGSRLAFERRLLDRVDIYLMSADGSNVVQLVAAPSSRPTFSRAGRRTVARSPSPPTATATGKSTSST